MMAHCCQGRHLRFTWIRIGDLPRAWKMDGLPGSGRRPAPDPQMLETSELVEQGRLPAL